MVIYASCGIPVYYGLFQLNRSNSYLVLWNYGPTDVLPFVGHDGQSVFFVLDEVWTGF